MVSVDHKLGPLKALDLFCFVSELVSEGCPDAARTGNAAQLCLRLEAFVVSLTFCSVRFSRGAKSGLITSRLTLMPPSYWKRRRASIVTLRLVKESVAAPSKEEASGGSQSTAGERGSCQQELLGNVRTSR